MIEIRPDWYRKHTSRYSDRQPAITVSTPLRGTSREMQTTRGPSPRLNLRRVAAQVESLPEARIRVTFREPLHGITPGQAVVLYAGERVLGGGIIEG